MCETFLRYWEKHNKVKEQIMETTLGKLAPEQAKRDAIHIAVAPVIAAQRLEAGDRIGFVDGEKVGYCTEDKEIGIVDPFLTRSIKEGERFYLLLYPRTITSLRHAWSHPAFPDEAIGEEAPQRSRVGTVLEAERWFDRNSPHGMEGDEFVARLREYIAGNDDNINVGNDSGYEPDYDEMWFHFEAITGLKVDPARRKPWFSCGC